MGVFHFLRPLWFFAAIPLGLLLWALWRRSSSQRSWKAVVDPQLLPHLLVGESRGRNPWAMAAMALGGMLAITALAGPVWSRQKVPVFRLNSQLVVLLDLSRSMNAEDLKPSRLQIARYKLQDILARRKEGDTALVVYAADPFVVTPLTSDTRIITRQLPVFTTDLMPVQGSRADLAIAKAEHLLEQAGASQGQVLLVTDGIQNTPAGPLGTAVQALVSSGYRLSVLGVGTRQGAPIPRAGGGFFKDDHGAIVWARLDEGALEQLAAAGHGIYRRLAPDDSDTDALTAFFDRASPARQTSRVPGIKSDQWQEQGPWLLLLLIPLAALAFRRGTLPALVLVLGLTLIRPAPASATGWSAWWQNRDQRGASALAQHHPGKAAKLFGDPEWRAVAHYRAGNYRAVLADLKGQPGATAAYDRGNALAHLGQFRAALDAYDQALKMDPGFADARYNRDLVRRWLKKQSRSRSSQGSSQKNSKPARDQGNSPSKSPSASKAGRPGQSKPGHDKPGQRGQSGRGQENPGDRKSSTSRPTPGSQGHGRQGQAHPANPGRGQIDRGGKALTARSAKDKTGIQAQRANVEEDQAIKQWLQRIPDDPGGLWRRKFLYQYQREYSGK